MTTNTAILLASAAMVAMGSYLLGVTVERQRYVDGAELARLCISTTEAQARALDSCTELLCNLASGSILEWEAAVYCEVKR